MIVKKYIPRIADELLKIYLECSGAVLIEGPKWCGKTTTAKQIASSVVELGDPDKKEYFALASISPSKLLESATPHLIDGPCWCWLFLSIFWVHSLEVTRFFEVFRNCIYLIPLRRYHNI